MINTKFEAYKLQRTLKVNGTEFNFKRSKLNEYKEPIKNSYDEIGTLTGLYHEQNSYISINYDDNVGYRSKFIPMILCLHEDAKALNFKVNDFVEYNGKTYIITGINNIQQWNLIDDISLEVVDYADNI